MDRDHLLFDAELATRYHRRRAAFLERVSIGLTFTTLLLSTAAVASVLAAMPGLAIAASLVIALFSVIQVVYRPQAHATQHTSWLRRWNTVLLEIRTCPDPAPETLKSWTKVKFDVESEHIGEMRALQADCYNRAARHLGLSNENDYVLKRRHRWLGQIISFEHAFERK